MKQYILPGMLILVFAACGGGDKPKEILSEKQMVNVMLELYLAEERVNQLALSQDSIKKIFPRFSAKAFDKAGIPDTVFRKSLDYYMNEPDKLERIYTIVVDSLNLKSQRVSAQRKKNAAVD